MAESIDSLWDSSQSAIRTPNSAMRILITGITGFVGGHLVEAWWPRATRLFGVCRGAGLAGTLAHLAGRPNCSPGDLADSAALEAVLNHARPGPGHPPRRVRQPRPLLRANRTAAGPTTWTPPAPLRRHRPLRPAAAHPVRLHRPDLRRTGRPGRRVRRADHAEAGQPLRRQQGRRRPLSYQYTRTPGLDIVRVRLFNQIGPRQTADYAVANFARQIAAAEAGRQPPVIETGDLSARRDITDVRDMVAALPAAAGEQAHRVRRTTPAAARRTAFRTCSTGCSPVARASSRFGRSSEPGRKADTAVTRADPAQAPPATGWQPRIPLDQTLADILDYWRKA